ncbi:hypothetical protein [Streptomyces sp. MH13]|uniref:hypothetical protein n=1 Tax=Streptomyces sp. MH13 TaxID=3417651 RepID=UPI003CF8BEDC
MTLLDTGYAAAPRLAARSLSVPRATADLDGLAENPLAAVRLVPSETPRHTAGARASSDLSARRSARPPLGGAPLRDALRTVPAAAVEASAGELARCAAVGEPPPGPVAPAPDGTPRRLLAGDARPTRAARAAGRSRSADAGAVPLGHGCPTEADAPRIRRAHLCAGSAVHRAHVTAGRHGPASRPVGSWQQRADLGAAPGADWSVHGPALGTTHSGGGTP